MTTEVRYLNERDYKYEEKIGYQYGKDYGAIFARYNQLAEEARLNGENSPALSSLLEEEGGRLPLLAKYSYWRLLNGEPYRVRTFNQVRIVTD